MTQKTILNDSHRALGAKMVDFGGWDMPIHYGSQIDEHHAVRQDAGMFDVSHMTVVDLKGERVREFLRRLVANSVDKLTKPGKALYTCMLDEQGGVIDDLIIYFLGEEFFRLVVNAGTRDKDLAWIARQAAPFGVEVVERDDLGLVAVQGPNARDKVIGLLREEDRASITKLGRFAARDAQLADGTGVFIARTGYTGEDGFEVFVANDDAPGLWQALVAIAEDGELTPAGLASRDSLRLEAGMPLYGNELSLQGDPFAAGLGPVVALSKESDFVGKAALAARKEAGAGSTAGRRLVGLKGLGRRAGRAHYPVLKDGTTIGEVTSGQPSPTLGYPVAMAYVDVAFTDVGTALDVDLRGKAEPFEVVDLPFYKRAK